MTEFQVIFTIVLPFVTGLIGFAVGAFMGSRGADD